MSPAAGVHVERVTEPSRLFGANGIRTGPDGRIYVAQVAGSTISAVDVATGCIDTIAEKGGDIVGPDDVDFVADGSVVATEYLDARVSVMAPSGAVRVIRDDLPGVNGITVYRDRLFVNECRPGGRLMELPLDGSAPRVLQDNVAMPNAMEVGPDGLLYYPVMALNEIWRIDPNGGEPQRVASGLGVPDSVKFDPDGFIISTQVNSGEVLRIDPRTGARTVLARLDAGLDNCTFVGDRLFVSHFSGEITEVLAGGRTRPLLRGGLLWPLDLTVGADDTLYIADGTFLYALRDGGLQTVASLFSPRTPGYVRGLAVVDPGWFVSTTSSGEITMFRTGFDDEPAVVADGFDQLYGIAVTSKGAFAFAEFGAGRVLSTSPSGPTQVLAEGLDGPKGVAVGPDDTVFVSESRGGRVVAIDGSGVDVIVDGLDSPQGLLLRGRRLLIVDAGLRSLLEVDLDTKQVQRLVEHLPVGVPNGVVAKPLNASPPFAGPMGPFAGITAGRDGTIYISADAEGSVVAVHREERNPA
ncbi:SMP-30/gluconolactonase/LRE family protein [Gordonia sp. NPDC127522]|uniref:SMP-30/gluconolactonase/LRE family protein n=1 Tax=Gordonia sp. NPDC127522 TaxID=3345390 RepID=UPI0036252760